MRWWFNDGKESEKWVFGKENRTKGQGWRFNGKPGPSGCISATLKCLAREFGKDIAETSRNSPVV
jgi:hypothetical protein